MRKSIAILVAFTVSIGAFAQPKPEDSMTKKLKLYFPVSNFKDSLTLEKAVPGLAEQIMAVFSEKDKTNYKRIAIYNLISRNYKKAIEAADSLEQKDNNPEGIEFRSFAVGKIKEQAGASFDRAFKEEYAAGFKKLSFSKKVSTAMLDTNYLNYFSKEYKDVVEKLKKNNSDSLSIEDARSFSGKYLNYTMYNRVFALILSIVNDPKYQRMYPVVKDPVWAGVVPVEGIDNVPDKNLKYKLLMELTGFAAKGQEDSVAKKEINGGLAEVGRKLNLHVAAGIPTQNVDLVIVVHAGALFAFLENDKYKKKYDVDNPNIKLIKQLQDFGAKIIVCGQAMTFLNLEMHDLVPGIKQALTAQTVLSTYQLKGYVFYDVSLE